MRECFRQLIIFAKFEGCIPMTKNKQSVLSRLRHFFQSLKKGNKIPATEVSQNIETADKEKRYSIEEEYVVFDDGDDGEDIL